MKKWLILPWILIFLLNCASTATTTGEDGEAEVRSGIFLANFFETPVDIRLGEEDNPVFLSFNLPPLTVSLMEPPAAYGGFVLYYRVANTEGWYAWGDSDGTPIICPVEKGKGHCIFVSSQGVFDFFIMDYPEEPGVILTFLNGTSDIMGEMAVGKDWDNVISYARDLGPSLVTDFVSFPPGEYGLFWQPSYLVEEGEYFYYPHEDGETLRTFYFPEGRYFAMLAYEREGGSYTALFDITREAEPRDNMEVDPDSVNFGE